MERHAIHWLLAGIMFPVLALCKGLPKTLSHPADQNKVFAQGFALLRLEQASGERPDQETVFPTTIPVAERSRGRFSGAA